MKKFWFAALAAAALCAQTAAPQPDVGGPATVKLLRLDCGAIAANDLDAFSDIRAYVGQSKRLTASCYLIRHGDTYMLWDTGLPAALKGKPIDPKLPLDATLTTTIVEQLARLGIMPEQIALIGISHYHYDHTGQAAAFPQATLMIGKGDFEAIKANAPGSDAKALAPWMTGTAKSEPIRRDKDVFGDGSVVMLDLPGHTPGHHGLLVRLARGGTILLSGDVAHFRENYDSDAVPGFNTSRADSLASLARFKALAKNLHATVILQHDPRDIAKLPAFPAWAE